MQDDNPLIIDISSHWAGGANTVAFSSDAKSSCGNVDAS